MTGNIEHLGFCYQTDSNSDAIASHTGGAWFSPSASVLILGFSCLSCASSMVVYLPFFRLLMPIHNDKCMAELSQEIAKVRPDVGRITG